MQGVQVPGVLYKYYVWRMKGEDPSIGTIHEIFSELASRLYHNMIPKCVLLPYLKQYLYLENQTLRCCKQFLSKTTGNTARVPGAVPKSSVL